MTTAMNEQVETDEQINQQLAVQLGWTMLPQCRCNGKIYDVPTWIRPGIKVPDGITLPHGLEAGAAHPEYTASLDLIARVENGLFKDSALPELEYAYLRQLAALTPVGVSPYRVSAKIKAAALLRAFRITSFR